MADIHVWSELHSIATANVLQFGDFDTDLDVVNDVSITVNNAILDGCLVPPCNELFFAQKIATYVNDALRQQSSHIDYVLVSNARNVADFCVIYPDLNVSDH